MRTTVSIRACFMFSVLNLCVACGGASNATPVPTSPSSAPAISPEKSGNTEVATGNTLTTFQKQRLLGHYSTEDGASGFILDRTVTPWRGKLDGTNKIVKMAETDTPHTGEKEFTSEDKSIWIRVHMESGRVLFFQGPKQHEGVRVVRDADAEQLK